ncbi:hypothetical protein DVH05_027719 [Phytophthora capsici]|nr:hypothetical protein DVH05_027719 [Phytophthora capsici]
MEDLRRDYGCRINFNQMFAGQRSGKSYSDRLATRTAASRKRKRTAAQIESGELPASAARKGKKTKAKAAKGGKKRKSPAAGRRASEGGAKATRGKRAKKTTSSTRRSSSATTYSSGINHYDDSAADFGEDLNTMAWEGVGSAGYL